MGLEAVIDGKTYFVGNGKLMDMAGAKWHECHMAGTVIHISEGAQYLGHIVINDEIKARFRRCDSEAQRTRYQEHRYAHGRQRARC